MKLSVITPTHTPKYLAETYQSLAEQTHQNWEWIIVPNGGAKVPDFHDLRIRIVQDYQPLHNVPIGGLKAKAASYATGDVIVELDHDDLLTSEALAILAETFRDQDVDFAYSNFAEFFDGTMKPRRYDASYGWLYRNTKVKDIEYAETMAPPAEPPYITNITHAPNHVRAWRTAFYQEIGGHNVEMEVADDYDLVIRTYLKARKIAKINHLLYLYRYYNSNTHVAKNQKIASEVHRLYEANVIPIMLRWCSDKALKAIDLGSAHNKPVGFSGCDIREAPGVDYVFDLEGEWPFDDNSVGVIRCYDALEHIRTEKKIHFFNEAWRVLAPGGALLIEVPSSTGAGSVMDPTHKSFWCLQSFWYHTKEQYHRFIAEQAPHAFMCRHLQLHYPSEFHQRENISYVTAHLFATKYEGHPAPLPIPSMYPPKIKARPKGTVQYTSPAEKRMMAATEIAMQVETKPEEPCIAPAIAMPVQTGTSPAIPQVTVPIDEEMYRIDETNLPAERVFERVLMKVDRSTPLSIQETTKRITDLMAAYQATGSLPPFFTKWHVICSISITHDASGNVSALVGSFIPKHNPPKL